jgi:hypothetical protein
MRCEVEYAREHALPGQAGVFNITLQTNPQFNPWRKNQG